MNAGDKPLVWLHEAIRTPPFSRKARVELGLLLRSLQRGDSLSMPHSRPMPGIARRCHELRVRDREATWRIIYRIEQDAIVLLALFKKKSAKTPRSIIELCRACLKDYEIE